MCWVKNTFSSTKLFLINTINWHGTLSIPTQQTSRFSHWKLNALQTQNPSISTGPHHTLAIYILAVKSHRNRRPFLAINFKIKSYLLSLNTGQIWQLYSDENVQEILPTLWKQTVPWGKVQMSLHGLCGWWIFENIACHVKSYWQKATKSNPHRRCRIYKCVDKRLFPHR